MVFPRPLSLGEQGQTREARLTFSELTPHSFATLIRTLFIGFDLSDAGNLDVISNHSKILPVGKRRLLILCNLNGANEYLLFVSCIDKTIFLTDKIHFMP